MRPSSYGAERAGLQLSSWTDGVRRSARPASGPPRFAFAVGNPTLYAAEPRSRSGAQTTINQSINQLRTGGDAQPRPLYLYMPPSTQHPIASPHATLHIATRRSAAVVRGVRSVVGSARFGEAVAGTKCGRTVVTRRHCGCRGALRLCMSCGVCARWSGGGGGRHHGVWWRR